MSECSCQAYSCPGAPFCSAAKECDPDEASGFSVRRPMVRGETVQIEYVLVNEHGSPLDVTIAGSQTWFTLKDYIVRADSQALWQGTYGAGVVQIEKGRIVVTIPASATQHLSDGVVKIYYDLRIKDSFGRVSTVEKGIFDVAPGVTRSI